MSHDVVYDAAVRHPLIHVIEHLSFIATGVLFCIPSSAAGAERSQPELA